MTDRATNAQIHLAMVHKGNHIYLPTPHRGQDDGQQQKCPHPNCLPGDIEPQIGREVVRKIYDGHFENIPGVHDAVQNIIAEGNQGSVEFIASWDQPTEDDRNARGNLRIAAFITVKNGKIIQDITYFDQMELDEKMDLGDGE